jgi:3-methyladenine DNA glycosylase AlkD
MKVKEARDLGEKIATRVNAGEVGRAHALLEPVLAERTPFAKLDLIGEAVGSGPLEPVNAFLEHIGARKTEGGWVVIGKALGQQLERDLHGALERCQKHIVSADVWYGADILGERVPGPGLVAIFEPTLELLAPWREDEDAWIRRTVGVAVHFWAKRSRGAEELAPRARILLNFMEPMFEELETSAVKGVGWGLKTLGKHYPDLVAEWLAEEIVPSERQYRAMMLHKAVTYLSEAQRARAVGDQL